MQKSTKITFSQSINSAFYISMKKNKKVILIGLGVPDPKSIFGTTSKLFKKFGPNRVFDMPTSENGMTGIVLGSSISGMRPILSHQRVEFALLSVEQIINQAAKWSYMTDGKQRLPLVIRMIIGRGWGQGPQHSQSLESLFAHIPGLKVVTPSTGKDAKGLMISSIEDNNPVIFFEHRWLHNNYDFVPNHYYKIPLGKANIMKKGKDITLVSFSYASILSLQAAKESLEFNIDVEVVDLRCLRPIDLKTVFKSVQKTKRLIIVDNGLKFFSISSEISSSVGEKLFHVLKKPPIRIGIKDLPIPSSREIAKFCYPSSYEILKNIFNILDKPLNKMKTNLKKYTSDVPDDSFKGPF